jgi:hypothetical protein
MSTTPNNTETTETTEATETVAPNYVLTGKNLDSIVAVHETLTDNEASAQRSTFDRTLDDGIALGKKYVAVVQPLALAAGITWNATKIMEAHADPTSVLFVPADRRAKFVSTSVLSRALDFARLDITAAKRKKFLAHNAPNTKKFLTALKIDANETLGNRDTTDVEKYRKTGVIEKVAETPDVQTPVADGAETPAAPVVPVDTATVAVTIAPVVLTWGAIEQASDDDIAAILAAPVVELAGMPRSKRESIARQLIASIVAEDRAAKLETLTFTTTV